MSQRSALNGPVRAACAGPGSPHKPTRACRLGATAAPGRRSAWRCAGCPPARDRPKPRGAILDGRRRQPGHGADPAQQFAGRKPQFTTAQLLHAAPSSGRFLLGLAAVLLEPSALHAQPTCRTERQKPAGIDDRPRPSALAGAAGPRATSAPPRLTQGGWPPPDKIAFEAKSSPHGPAVSARPLQPKNGHF
jgi:hypothetical protein